MEGTTWTIESLKAYVAKIEDEDITEPQQLKGIKCLPVFDAIAVDHFTFPLLHVLLGIGTHDVGSSRECASVSVYMLTLFLFLLLQLTTY